MSRVIHWLTATLMAATVALGLYSTSVPLDSEAREIGLFVHKSLGLAILALTVVRLGWTAYSPGALDRGRLRAWEVHAARTGHALLYAILLLMPLSGIMISQGAGREVGFFGLFELPQLLPVDPALPPRGQYLYGLGKFLHDDIFQWALYAIFAFHMAGVVKHRFADGDQSFLRRMWGRRA